MKALERFEHRQPLPRRGVGHARVVGNLGKIEQLPGAPGEQAEELDELRQVALHVGLDALLAAQGNAAQALAILDRLDGR